MWRRLVVVASVVIWITLLASCATKYHPNGYTGGFSETRVDSNTFTVHFRGNGYTGRDTVETYLMYRCAELTTTSGYDYFVIVGGNTDAKQGVINTPGTYSATTTGSATAYGNTAYGSATTTGTYLPGQAIQVTRYGATATIKMFKGEKPAENPSAYNAREVIGYLATQIR